MKKTALYIGRFQPFHLGHLDAIKQIFADEEIGLLLIAIGSAENPLTGDNPLNAAEREEIIVRTLKEAKISAKKYTIIPVSDINNPPRWVAHLKALLPPFDIAYSGEKAIRDLFSAAGVKAKVLKKNKPFSASLVRQKMQNGGDVSSMLSSQAIAFLEKLGLKERLKSLNSQSTA